MAEIKDVYSLEFNSSQFQSELQSAIQRIEELNDAMNEGKDSANDLSDAQLLLENTLKKEATSIDGLNSKKRELQKIQSKLNVDSQEFKKVNNEINNINKKLADSTANVTNQQRSFNGSLIQGARQIGSMRRVVSQLGFAFRLMGSLLPFGLIMSFAGPVLSFFGSLFKSTDKTAENMDRLKDSTISYSEKITIVEDELAKLQNIEAKNGKLTEEEMQRRQELTNVYKQTSDEIVKIEEDRAKRMQELEFSIQETRIKLLGDTSAAVIEQAKFERNKTLLESQSKFDEIYNIEQELFKQLKIEQDRYNATYEVSAFNAAQKIQDRLNKNGEAYALNVENQNLKLAAIEQEKNKRLADIQQKAIDDERRKALDAANKAIEDETNRLKLEILRTEEGSQDRLDAEANMIDQLLILRQKYAKELELDNTELSIMQLEGLEEREKLFDKYYENLKQKQEKNKDVIIGPTKEDFIQKLKLAKEIINLNR